MKSFAIPFAVVGALLSQLPAGAADLKQSKLTQVINEVQIISSADKSARAAAVNDLFKMPDILRTGPNSRAELIAEDQTITRVGANTVFSFDPATRTIDLQKGSLLFHSPTGRGGGTVRTGSATASVLGTTIVVTTTPDGGFKVLVLEGNAEVKFRKGLAQHLSGGQMTFLLPGGGMSPVIVFRLDQNIRGSQLIHGFPDPLPSMQKISDEIGKQSRQIQKGKIVDTGLLVGDKANPSQVEAVDANALQNYFNQRTTYRPPLLGGGYLSVDGFLVQPYPADEPVSDALLPATALSVNVDVSHSTLDPRHIFVGTGPFLVSVPGFSAETDFLPNLFTGFFGRNINVSSATIDLAPYAALPFFDILAAQNLNIRNSVNFQNFSGALYVTAGGQIVVAPGATISAAAQNLYLGSFGPMTFNNVNIENSAGSLRLSSLAAISLRNGTLSTGADINLFSPGAININGTEINSIGGITDILSTFAGDAAAPAVTLNNATINSPGGAEVLGYGNVAISGSSINSANGGISLASLNGSLSLNGGSFYAGNESAPAINPSFVSSPGTLRVSAGTDLNVSGTALTTQTLSVNSGGSTTINGGAALTAATIMLNAGNGILLDNVLMKGDSLHVTAVNDVNIGSAAHHADLTSFSDVVISGHTLALQNTDFRAGSSPLLQSDVGQLAANPNTGQAVQRGYVNFINGVTYGGALITSGNQSTYVNPSAGPGVIISARP